jgi:hypothetical protein
MTKEVLDSVLDARALAKAASVFGLPSLTQQMWASALISTAPASVSNVPTDQVRAVISASLGGCDDGFADRTWRDDPRGAEALASALVNAALAGK